MIDSRFNILTRFTPAVVISEDRNCHRCAYNLKGLKSSDRCPECGTPIRAPAVRFDDVMAQAPAYYLQWLARAAFWMVAGIFAGCGLFAVLALFLRSAGVVALAAAVGYLLAGLAAGWGTWRVCAPRVSGRPQTIDLSREWAGLRFAARWSQWAWTGAAVALLLGVTIAHGALPAAPAPGAGPPPVPQAASGAYTVAAFLALVGFAGLLPLAILLSLMADWAQDMNLAMRLRLAPFMLLISLPQGVCALWLGTFMRFTWVPLLVLPLLGVVGATFLFCFAFFAIPLWQFERMCGWALRNAGAASDRDRRMASRIMKRIEGGRARDTHEPGSIHTPSGKVVGHGHRVEPTGDGETYDLAPPTPGPEGPPGRP